MYILFCCTNQKNVLQKEIKDWAFEVHLLSGEPSQFLIPADWVIENDLGQILWVVLDFFIKIRGLGLFFAAKSLAQNSIKLWPAQRSKYNQEGSIFTCPKSEKWLSIVNCSKLAKLSVWKSLYLQSWRSQKHQIWAAGKPHSKGSFGYPNSKRYRCHYLLFMWLWKISLSLATGATVTKFGQ